MPPALRSGVAPGADLHQVGEVAAARDAVDEFGVDAAGRGVLLDVDDRRLGGDLHVLADARDRERESTRRI